MATSLARWHRHSARTKKSDPLYYKVVMKQLKYCTHLSMYKFAINPNKCKFKAFNSYLFLEDCLSLITHLLITNCCISWCLLNHTMTLQHR